jgi:hypothetical protein
VTDEHPVVDGPVENIDGHLQVEVLSELAALDAELDYLPGLRPPYRKPARTQRLGELRVRLTLGDQGGNRPPHLTAGRATSNPAIGLL